MNRFYLAYGSNLNLVQMASRCPGAEWIGSGELEGWELLYKGSKTGAYLTIEKKKGGKVPIGVFTVTEEDEKRLDRYEGCPAFYYKKEVPIEVPMDGKTIQGTGFIYIMHEDRPLGLPTRWYVDTCMQGYEDFGFDKNYLYEAEARTWKRKGWRSIK